MIIFFGFSDLQVMKVKAPTVESQPSLVVSDEEGTAEPGLAESGTADSLLLSSSITKEISKSDEFLYFAKNTFSKECAMLGFNFYMLLSEMGVFEHSCGSAATVVTDVSDTATTNSSDERVAVISILYFILCTLY